MNLNDRIDAIEEKVNNSSIPTGNMAAPYTKKWYKMKLNVVRSVIGMDDKEDEKLVTEWESGLDEKLAAESGKPEPFDPFAGMPDFVRETLEKL